MTVWRCIPGFGGRYEASDQGEVRHAKTGRIVKKKSTGAVAIYKTPTKQQYFQASRLVLLAFVGEPGHGETVHRLDPDSTSDCLTNLEWKNPRPGAVWKTIPGYSKYEASTDGDIRNKATWEVLQRVRSRGYNVLTLYDDDGKQVQRRVAPLILRTFVGEPAPGQTADHVNSTAKLDDRLENLRWATLREQALNRQREDRNLRRVPVAQLDLFTGKILAEYPSARAAGRSTGVSQGNISACLQGKQRQSGGFAWQYAEEPHEDLEDEEWRTFKIDGLDTKVDFSQYGRVRDRRRHFVTKRYAREYMTEFGEAENLYPVVMIRGVPRYIHCIVAELFLGPRPAGMVVHHKNHIKSDARACNLAYVTPSQNTRAAVEAGRFHRSSSTAASSPVSPKSL